MKKISMLLCFLAISATLWTSCKKDPDTPKTNDNPYKCTSCTTTPDALASNDGSSKGVYKGIVIGSTGTVKFSVQNGTNDITATLVIDGVTATLTSSVAWVSGEPYIAPFTGTLNGQAVSITFSVQNDGGSPTITSADIPGHPNAVFTLVKETSNTLVECFEGTYTTSKSESGTFNILLSRTLGKFGGIARKDGSTEESDVDGTIDQSGTIKDEDGNVLGTLSGDTISGSFTDSDGATVTINGKRTL